MQENENPSIVELRDNAIAEVEYLEAQRVLRSLKGFPLTESVAENNFIDPYEYLRDQGQWSFIGPTNAAIGAGRPDMRGDRDHGRDWPLFQTETELGYFRAMGRAITNHIPAGINILESLTNYVIGTGMNFECRPTDNEGDKALAGKVQRIVDQFLDDNDFVGDLDRELHARSRKDGEFFVKVERQGWRTRLRVIEPACVTEPMDQQSLCDALDCGGPCDWRFGIHTAASDASRVYGYHVVYDGVGQDWEYLRADQCEHFKRNTDRNVKRGVSDFYPVDAWLKRTEKLLRNTTGGAAIQAAIAFIREHGASASASSVDTFRASKAWDTINRYTPSGYASKSIQKFDEGTVLDVGQQKYSAGPMGAGEATAGYIAVLQAALRYVGIRWSMPEYLISGDASNANYASTKEAGTPFVKAREADQAFYVSRFRRLAWKAVKNAIDGGALPGLTMEQVEAAVEINVIPPRVDSRDTVNETSSDKTLVDSGAMSLRTMAIRAGLDFDREVSQGAKPVAPQSPMGGLFGGGPSGGQQQSDWQDSQDDEESDNGDPQDVQEGAVHAPHNMKIGGKEYKGGEFIPSDVIANATPEEKKQLEGRKDNDNEGGKSKKRQIDTPEFKAWFGDSKVVDANGDPMIVYHGSKSGEIVEFSDNHDLNGAGIWFAEKPGVANKYAGTSEGASVTPVYLSIRNPVPRSEYIQAFSESGGSPSKAIELLKKRGFDGMKSRVPGSETWMVFDANQIKSATGNRGTFDPKSKKITESYSNGDPQDVQEGAVHAPHNMKIGGKEYKGGEFIPGDVVAKATPEEKIELSRSMDANRNKRKDPSIAEAGKVSLSSIAGEVSDYIDQVPELNPHDNKKPIIVEIVNGKPGIVDGFHRTAGMIRWARSNGVDIHEININVVIAKNEKLISAAAEPGEQQAKAIKRIYASAGILESYDESDHPRDDSGKWTRHVGGASHGYLVKGKEIAHLSNKGAGKYSLLIQHPTEKKHREVEITAASNKEARETAVRLANEHRAKAIAAAASSKKKAAAEHAKEVAKWKDYHAQAKADHAEAVDKIAKIRDRLAGKQSAFDREWDTQKLQEWIASEKKAAERIARAEAWFKDHGSKLQESAEGNEGWQDGSLVESADSQPDLFSAASEILWGAYP